MLNGIRTGRRECIAAAASLMAYQWLEQKMPLPDLLIPLPISFWHKQRLGYDPHRLVALELSKIFCVPTRLILRQKFDRKRFLTQGEFSKQFEVIKRRKEMLCDRKVLLISALLEDGVLRSVGKELKAFFPTQIDALSFGC